MTEPINETIGCDLGDKATKLFVLKANGDEERPEPLATSKEGFRSFFAIRPRAQVVLENGTHSRWVSGLLSELGHEVIVANPYRVKLISQTTNKSDERDAELLARLARADRKLLAPIQHRGVKAQSDLAVAKTRDTLVGCRSKLINQARGLVKSFGARLPKCDAEGFHRQTREFLPVELRPALSPLYEALDAIEKQIKALDKTLMNIAKSYPEVERLSQPAGVGLLTALVFVLTLEDKTRFSKSRMVGAYVGLTPRRDQTGATDKQLPITKAGDGMLRRLLVQCANYILSRGPDTDLRRWGRTLAARGGKNATKRAKVAVARKLAVILHRMWVTGEKYEPLRNMNKQTMTH